MREVKMRKVFLTMVKTRKYVLRKFEMRKVKMRKVVLRRVKTRKFVLRTV